MRKRMLMMRAMRSGVFFFVPLDFFSPLLAGAARRHRGVATLRFGRCAARQVGYCRFKGICVSCVLK